MNELIVTKIQLSKNQKKELMLITFNVNCVANLKQSNVFDYDVIIYVAGC